MAAALSKMDTDPSAHAQDPNAWRIFVRGLLKHVRNNSKRVIEAFSAECDVFVMLEEAAGANVRVVRSAEAAEVDGAFVVVPTSAKDIPPLGTPFSDMLRWADSTTGVRFLTFDVKSVVFRPINFNQHIRAGFSDISYKWTDTHSYMEKAPIIITIFEGVENKLAIMPREVWKAARDYGYGIEPLIQKSPPYSDIFMVEDLDLSPAVQTLLKAAEGKGNFRNPSTRVTFDGWHPEPVDSAADLMPMQSGMDGSVRALWQLQDLIQACGHHKMYANMMQPLIADCVLEVEGVLRAIWLEHKLRLLTKGVKIGRFETGGDSPWNPARVWNFCIIENSGAGSCRYICVPRDAVKDGWHQLTSVPWHELSEFACEDVQAMLKLIKERAQGAFDAAHAALGRLTTAGEEALVSSRSIEVLQATAKRRQEAYSRPLPGPKGKGAEYYLKNLPWLSVDLNRMCEKYRDCLVFPVPDGQTLGTHTMVDYAWDDFDVYDNELPHMVHDREIAGSRAIVLRFIDLKPLMSGVPDIGWPINFARRDWQRPSVAQHFLYVGSWMKSEYMESPKTRKQYWLFSSEFTTQLEQGFKAPIRQSAKPANYFARTGQEDEKLSKPPLQGGRRPTPVLPGSGFLNAASKNINPARYILEGEEELYLHLRDILKGTRPRVSVDSAQGFTPNRPITAAKHHTVLSKVQTASWDCGIVRRPDKLPETENAGDVE